LFLGDREALLVPDARESVEGIQNVATMVEAHLSNGGVAAPEGELVTRKGVVEAPGATELLESFARRDPNASAKQKSFFVRSHGLDAVLPNGSRVSCGRNADGRKAAEGQKQRLAGEATRLLPTCERPAASSAC